MICPHCNATIDKPSASFCPSCGKSLSDGGSAAKKKGRVVAIAVVAVVAIIAVVAAVLLYVNAQSNEKVHTTHAVKIAVSVEGADGSTTNIPVSVEGTDLDGAKVSETCYVDVAGEGLELAQGTYTISFPASPLSADGSIWKAPSETISFTIVSDVEPGAAFEGASSSAVKFAKLDPIDVTDSEIELAYKYAADDPEFKSVASTYRDASTKAHIDAANGPTAATPANSNKYTMTGVLTVVSVNQYFQDILSKTGANEYVEADIAKIGSAINGTVVLLTPTKSCNVKATQPSTGKSYSFEVGSAQDAMSGHIGLKYFAQGESTCGWEKYDGRTVTVEVCFTKWADDDWDLVYELMADSARIVS